MTINENEVVQGRIFYLPKKDELPERALRRAHGKGKIDDDCYGHPVIIVSRPAGDKRIAHLLALTSFKGRGLIEMYPKPDGFDKDMRSHFLPIYPIEHHPDAVKNRRSWRFPRLTLADGALLRKNSWVNITKIYKIDISHLVPYTAELGHEGKVYRLERESLIKMISKCSLLTAGYKPGRQLSIKVSEKPISDEEFEETVAEMSEEQDLSTQDLEKFPPLPVSKTAVATSAAAASASNQEVLQEEIIGPSKGKKKTQKWKPLSLA